MLRRRSRRGRRPSAGPGRTSARYTAAATKAMIADEAERVQEDDEADGHRHAQDDQPELLGQLAGGDVGVGAVPQRVDEGEHLGDEGSEAQDQNDEVLDGEDVAGEKHDTSVRGVRPPARSSPAHPGPGRSPSPRRRRRSPPSSPRPAARRRRAAHQRLGDRPRRGRGPARPAPLAGVGVQRELADHEDRRTDVQDRLLAGQDAAARRPCGPGPAPRPRRRRG